MSGFDFLWAAWGMAAIVMVVMWWMQYVTKNANLVDVAWAAGLGVLAVFYGLAAEGDSVRRGVMGLLAALWSGRLARHILLRVLEEKEEDGRYQRLRAYWDTHTQLKFFLFYQAQALAIVLFSVPFLVVATTVEPLPKGIVIAAASLWVIAVGGEALADRQLEAWRSDPRNQGRTCRGGLWRYSRHPNYFFEWLHWWTYVLLASGSPWWWLTLLGPILMLFLLFKVTGIPQTERHALSSRGDDYRSYQRSTSVFFPWFPKKEK